MTSLSNPQEYLTVRIVPDPDDNDFVEIEHETRAFAAAMKINHPKATVAVGSPKKVTLVMSPDCEG